MKTLLTFALVSMCRHLVQLCWWRSLPRSPSNTASAKTVMVTLGAMAQGKMVLMPSWPENAAILENTYKLAWVGFGPGTEAATPNRHSWKEQDKVKQGWTR